MDSTNEGAFNDQNLPIVVLDQLVNSGGQFYDEVEKTIFNSGTILLNESNFDLENPNFSEPSKEGLDELVNQHFNPSIQTGEEPMENIECNPFCLII